MLEDKSKKDDLNMTNHAHIHTIQPASTGLTSTLHQYQYNNRIATSLIKRTLEHSTACNISYAIA